MIDKAKIETAVKLLLEGIGEDVNRPGLIDTPNRIARMCEEIFGGSEERVAKHLSKTFDCTNNDLVLEKDIPVYSMCEHHLLPFYGKAHIAYIPDGKVAGLSKLARTVEEYSHHVQLQEQLTAQVADAMMKYLQPKGVMVAMEAEHMCMTMRGVKKPGAKTMTYVCRGIFEEDNALVDRVLCMIR